MTSYRGLFGALALCVFITLPLVRSSAIPETEKDIPTTESPGKEPEVVQISHTIPDLRTREQFHLRFTNFPDDVDVMLTPTKGILLGDNAPVWHATTKNGKVDYRRLNVDILKKAVIFYQSQRHNAAILVRGDQRTGFEFLGTIGKIAIRPARPNPRPTNRHRRSVTDDGMMLSGDHWVTRLDEESKATFDDAIMEVAKSLASEERSKREAPAEITIGKTTDNFTKIISSLDVVYPTILATADFPINIKTGKDEEFFDSVLYQMAFWNSVDLRYRSLDSPKIRLRIAGLIFATDLTAAPYLNHPVYVNNNKDVNGEVAANEMQDYWFAMRDSDDFSIDSYHIAVTTTFRWFSTWNRIRGWSEFVGIARPRPICNTTTGYTMRPVAISYDDQAFSGVTTTTHEIGHVLGLEHDRRRQSLCPTAFGYIMDPVDATEPRSNNVQWSTCSKDQLSRLLSTATCMENPLEHVPLDSSLAKILPASLMNAEKQCKTRGWDHACTPTAKTCGDLKCYASTGFRVISTFMSCQSTGPALDGTLCGNSQICIAGECKAGFTHHKYD